MVKTPEAAAREILASLRQLGTGSPGLVRANLAEFPHLDRAGYDAFAARLEPESFRLLGDLEPRELSQDDSSLMRPTVIRMLASPDGMITAEYYEVRHRLVPALWIFLGALLDLRWRDAFRWLSGALRVCRCVGFDTEFEDGSFVVTSNAELAGALASPACIDARFFPFGTATDLLLGEHRARVAQRGDAGAAPVPCLDLEDVIAAASRMKTLKNAYRQSLDWVTREELRNLAPDREVADAVFALIRTELAAERRGKPPAGGS